MSRAAADDGPARPESVRAAIAEALAQTAGAERDRARCLEVLDSLSFRERGSGARLEAAQRARRALESRLEAHQRREAELRAEIADIESAQHAARSEIRPLQRRMSRLSMDEEVARRALAELEARTTDAVASAASARERVLRVSYKLTRDETSPGETKK